MKEDPSQFAVPEPLVEAFQPLEFLHDRVGHPELAARREDLQGVGHKPEHALLGKLAFEAPHGVRMGPGFLGPLRRSVLGTEQ
jgi:hypothetical protein